MTMKTTSDERGRDYSGLVSKAAELAVKGPSREDAMRLVTDLLWDGLSEKGVDWLGFYLTNPAGDAMLLSCCRPKPACSPIGLHGVCGKGYLEGRPQVVEDVYALGDDHIVCDPENLSELVVPLFDDGGRCYGVIDLDSKRRASFRPEDAEGIEAVLVAAGLSRKLPG